MFELLTTSAGARLGRLQLRDVTIDTPVFMPVGTLATVKGITAADLYRMGYRLLLGNNYHLIQRPGVEVLADHRGLAQFMGWQGAVLTDSGGYQVFSLNDTCRIEADGVRFRSIYNGDSLTMTPTSVIDSQRAFKSDIMMPLDICPSWPSERRAISEALQTTTRWAQLSHRHWRLAPANQHLYGIIQGGCYMDLRQRALESLLILGFSGYAIGGLAVGEPRAQRNEILSQLTPLLPVDQPRYLMGVGTPRDLIDSVALGVDQFDCVIPTRHGRNGHLYTSQGAVRIRHAAHRTSSEPLDRSCTCLTCQHYTRAYLHHLYRNREMLGAMLGTIHNLHYYYALMAEIRSAIQQQRFAEFYRAFIDSPAAESSATGPPELP